MVPANICSEDNNSNYRMLQHPDISRYVCPAANLFHSTLNFQGLGSHHPLAPGGQGHRHTDCGLALRVTFTSFISLTHFALPICINLLIWIAKARKSKKSKIVIDV